MSIFLLVRGQRLSATMAWCAGVAALAVATATLPVRGGTIFDDDWTPPARVEPTPTAPPPRTPSPVPPTDRGPRETVVSPPATAVPQTGVPNAAPVATPAVALRRALPKPAEQEKSRKLMKDVFSKELQDRSPAARKALGQRLLDDAAKMSDAPSDQYIVFGGAIQSALEAGDLPLALDAADRMAATFDVDALALKANVAMKKPPRSYAADAASVTAALDLLPALEAADDYADAARLASTLQQAPVTDPALRDSVLKSAKDIEEARVAWERLGPAFAKLKASPDDPGANGAVGRFRAMVRGDWEKGLPLLAKGDNPKLAALATAALAEPTDAAARARLADGWWEQAQRATGLTKANLLERSAADYRLALPGLTGLGKVLAEKRIADAAANASAGAASAGTTARTSIGGGGATVFRAGATVHLLPLATDKDLEKAKWHREGSTVISDPGGYGCVTLPCLPPEEYDLAAEFSRSVGEGDIALTFPVGKGICTFAVSVDHNSHAAMGRISAKWKDGNPTYLQSTLSNNTRHRMQVKVRRGEVSASLDGKQLSSWRTNGSDLSGSKSFIPRAPGLLGVGTLNDTVTFYSVDLTAVSGTGAMASERDAHGSLYNPTVLRPSAGGAVQLPLKDSTLHGKEITLDNETGEPDACTLVNWGSSTEYVTWFVEVPKPGDYTVEITIACPSEHAGSDVEFGLEPAKDGRAHTPLTLHVPDTGGWQQFHAEKLGKLHLPAGRQTLSLRAKTKPYGGIVNVRQVVLTPAH